MGAFQENLYIWNQESIIYKMVMDFFNFETFCFGCYWLLLLAIAHVGMEIPRSSNEGSMPDSVSLLQQEIANCALEIQEIKVKLNRLSSPKTKEQFEQYNKCVQELDIARKVYQTKVQEFEELQSELL